MEKRIKKLISIILCFTLILAMAACGGQSTPSAKKKKKKIIKIIRKNSSQSQSMEDNSLDSQDSSNSDYDFDSSPYDNYDSQNDQENQNDSPKYEVDLDNQEISETNQKIGMAIYHYKPMDWTNLVGNKYGKETSFLNYFRVDNIEEAKQVKKMGGMCWIYVRKNGFNSRDSLELQDSWKDNITYLMSAYKSAGVWDVIAGFETEEMCLSHTSEQYRIVTKWLRDHYPDKRIFACLSPYEVQGYGPSGFNVAPMSYEAYGYVTDIGYDWYETTSYEAMKNYVDLMLENLGREKNVRVWFFPSTQKSSVSYSSEEYTLTHLNNCYKLLMEQKNPGGLYCYTWCTFSKNTGLADLINPSKGNNYDNLAKRIVEIGQQIQNNPYRYVRDKN